MSNKVLAVLLKDFNTLPVCYQLSCSCPASMNPSKANGITDQQKAHRADGVLHVTGI